MAGINDPSQLKMDTKTTLKASDIHIHDFSFEKYVRVTGGDDVLDRISRAARQASHAQAKSSLKVAAIDIGFDGLRADLGDESPEDILLREAKALVGEQEYKAALEKLEEVFAIDTHHHEATYLAGYCQFELNHLCPALKVLLPLRDAALSNRLATRVRALKEEIRRQTIPEAASSYNKAVTTRSAKSAMSPLREFAEVDPDIGKFHYFLAGALLINKQVAEAREAVNHGLSVSDTDREELEDLLREIDTRYLPQMLGPARDYYRKRNYSAAARALGDVDEQVRTNPLWIAFHNLLEQYNGKKSGGFFSKFVPGRVKSIAPAGSHAEMNALYEFLVKPEMQQARQAIGKNDFVLAEKILETAVSCVPNFSLANQMLATCVYQRVGATVKQRIGQDLNDTRARELRGCQHQLDEVRKHAEIGARDHEIADARLLVESIDEMRNEIEEVVDTYETRVHDARIVNEAVDEFIQILLGILRLNAASNRWEIRSSAEDLYQKLSRSRGNLASRRRKCRGDESKKIMDLLRDNFVEPHYNTLSRLMNR